MCGKGLIILISIKYGSESAEGKRYLTFYSIENYPHVAIIDARTGNFTSEK
jgi:hypothetical protein